MKVQVFTLNIFVLTNKVIKNYPLTQFLFLQFYLKMKYAPCIFILRIIYYHILDDLYFILSFAKFQFFEFQI